MRRDFVKRFTNYSLIIFIIQTSPPAYTAESYTVSWRSRLTEYIGIDLATRVFNAVDNSSYSKQLPPGIHYGFAYDGADGLTCRYGDQSEFQIETHNALELITKAISDKEPWVENISDVYDVLASLRLRMLIKEKSVLNGSQESFMGKRHSDELDVMTGLNGGTREQVRNSFLKNIGKELATNNLCTITLNSPYSPEGLPFVNFIYLVPESHRDAYAFTYKGYELSCIHFIYPCKCSLEYANSLSLSEFKNICKSNAKKFARENEEIKTVVMHCPELTLEKKTFILEEMQDLYVSLLENRDSLATDEAIKTIAKIHWLYVQSSLHTRGGGWIPETLAIALMRIFTIPFARWQVETWERPISTSLNSFCENYGNFFVGTLLADD